MSRQVSGKRGLQSTARKRANSRHGTEPTPAAKSVSGAFGKGDRRTPRRAGTVSRPAAGPARSGQRGRR